MIMARLLSGVAVATFTSTISAGAQQAVRVGYAYANPPFASLPGGTPANYATLDPSGVMAQGAAIDLIRAIARDAGFDVQFVPMPVGDLIPALLSKKVDALARVEIPGIAQKVIALSDPIDTDTDGLVVKKSDATPYASWAELRGSVIGAVAGTAEVGPLARSGLFPQVRTYASGSEMYQAISSGEIDAGVSASAVGAGYLFAHAEYPNLQLVESYKPQVAVVTAIAMRPDAADLLAKVDASLARLRRSGAAEMIYATYGIGQYLAP